MGKTSLQNLREKGILSFCYGCACKMAVYVKITYYREFFSAVNTQSFNGKNLMFLIFLLKI